jgi:[protein-PII] uridylyltransferase
MVNHFEAYSEITIITKDAPFVLSKCCGVLAANDANIFDAQIFTRSDGIVIDRFRVFDFLTRAALTESQSRKICTDLEDVLEGRINTEHLLQRHQMRWRRRISPPEPTLRLGVTFEAHPRYTIVDVFAADTLGFLYKITELMSELGLGISFAKIATRADGIVDSFYVLDSTGRRIDDEGRKNVIRAELLKAVEHLAHTELVLQ